MSKRVIVMSGVSGSGKTTYIKNRVLSDESWSPRTVVSADNFFMRDGKYRFDASKLNEAHGQCFREFIEALRIACPLVVVDNTNTREAEISPYMLGAQAFGYDAVIYTMKHASDLHSMTNDHGVSLSLVEAQCYRMFKRVLCPWWKEIVIDRDGIVDSGN